MTVKRIFPAVPADIRDWTRYLTDLFYAREFTVTLTGCTTVPTGGATFTVSAGIVSIFLPTTTGTSNTTAATLTGLPEKLWPALTQHCLAVVRDNGVDAIGKAFVGVDGVITLGQGFVTTAFTASGSKGIIATTITYSLDGVTQLA